MFASTALGFFAGGSGLVTPLVGFFANDVGSPATYTASAAINFGSSGVISKTVHGSTTNAGNWHSPNVAGVGADYWVRATLVAGGPLASGAVNTWLSLAAVRTWSVSVTSGYREASLLIEISSDAAGASVVTSGTFNLYAESTN